MKRALELFSGTHSFAKVVEPQGYEVVSVDITDYKGKHPVTHKVDIMEFDYRQYPTDHFDIIWASPPCIYYSRLQNSWLGRAKKNGEILTKELLEEKRIMSDELVRKVLEIKDYFNPRLWFMENPATGCLKTREVVKDIDYYDVDYCKYSDWGYKKTTRIWTNRKGFEPKRCKQDCPHIIKVVVEGKSKVIHPSNCGNTKQRWFSQKHAKNMSSVGGGSSRLKRYRVPPKLINELVFF
tara:strand:- start:3948 stop:4661 length:714 start_codon:yes stop_codon:yes gene_type:complete